MFGFSSLTLSIYVYKRAIPLFAVSELSSYEYPQIFPCISEVPMTVICFVQSAAKTEEIAKRATRRMARIFLAEFMIASAFTIQHESEAVVYIVLILLASGFFLKFQPSLCFLIKEGFCLFILS